MVIANQFEDSEAISPRDHLVSLGATVTLIGPDMEPVTGKKGAVLTPGTSFADAGSVDRYDALVIPGGGAPENLRIIDKAVAFTKAFVESGKPVASICHGPQLLISAKVLSGRTTTCVKKIRDDVINAGATYVDEALVIDGNLISSRTPADLEVFNHAIAVSVGLTD
jgi:protease I